MFIPIVTRAGISAVVVVTSLLAMPEAAQAYDHKHTHRWIVRQAAKLLVARYPGQYEELLDFIDDVADGAEHEDDLFVDGDDDPTTLRVQRHFFRPVDRAGLTMSGQTFPSSYDWAVVGGDDNDWDWRDGIDAYARGDKVDAYFTLGHVVHLVADLTVPAHTHLDIHGPPFGDDYEGYCSAQMIDEHTSHLPSPALGTPIPEFSTPDEAWMRTAHASYWRALYPGRITADEATGVIAQMFPSLSWSWLSEEWTIDEPPVGDLGDDFFEDEPGFFYFKNSEHPAAYDRAGFDATDPTALAFEVNAGDAPMTELMARDLVPLAILHTAGVMKLYLDEAYAHPPVETPDDDPTVSPEPAGGCAAGGRSTGAPVALLALALLWWRRR